MVDISGRPFLDYQLELLRRHGVADVVLCIGHLGDKIQEYVGDGRRYGMRVDYSLESETLLGTAGAVKQAEALLDDVFFLTYADAYLSMDYEGAWKTFGCMDRPAMMVVLHNRGRYERSNLVVAGAHVTVYDKVNDHPGMEYINFGVSLHRRDSLELVPPGEPFSQEDWYQTLIAGGGLAAFETQHRFYEIGSPSGLAEFRSLAAAGQLQ
jgi:NDP-sugar pyrophosphorylase family protein